MVWDDKHSDQLQNHDHVVSFLVRPYILHRKIVFPVLVDCVAIEQLWYPLNAACFPEVILDRDKS